MRKLSVGMSRAGAGRLKMVARARRFKTLALIMVFLGMTVNMPNAFADAKKLLVFGDSLVAGYGLPPTESFPAQLGQKLAAEGHDVKVIGAGVSGDTTSGALTRLDWTLKQQKPDYAILVIGGNDMLRQVDRKVTRANLQKMLETFKSHKIPVLLTGMRGFQNFDDLFGGKFQQIYEDLAEEYDVLYYPFFLDGVAMDARFNLDDGIHPNKAGIALIVEKIFDDVEDLLEEKVEH